MRAVNMRPRPLATVPGVWRDACGWACDGVLSAPGVQEGGPWQATLRAICALEAVIQLGHTEVCGKIAVAFQVSQPRSSIHWSLLAWVW